MAAEAASTAHAAPRTQPGLPRSPRVAPPPPILALATSRGLVPWYFLVSAAHAEVDAAEATAAAAALASRDDDYDLDPDRGHTLRRPVAAADAADAGFAYGLKDVPEGGFVTEVRAMRGTAGLGLDLDNQNIVRRISPGSMAEQQGARAHPLAGVMSPQTAPLMKQYCCRNLVWASGRSRRA